MKPAWHWTEEQPSMWVRGSPWRWTSAGLLAGAAVVSLATCAIRFERFRPQWSDALWPVGVALWVVAFLCVTQRPWLRLRIDRTDLLLFASGVVLLAATWLPFAFDWRWAYTGDSIVWFTAAQNVVERGPWESVLSVHGPDNNATFLSLLTLNWAQLVFEPTFFWHRVSMFFVAVAGLGCMYALFRGVLRSKGWAAAIVAFVAANYVWQRYSHVSYQLPLSYPIGYGILALGLLLWRDPQRSGLWLVTGLWAGVSLMYTQTAWSDVLAVAVLLALLSWRERRWTPLLACGSCFLVGALPALIQIPAMIEMNVRQSQPGLDYDYLWRIFRSVLVAPYHSQNWTVGGYGAYLRPPLGALYFVGAGIAVLGIVPPLRRAARIPAAAPVLLLLLIWHAALLALTNNQYPHPSLKRAMHLIPLQIFFALLPFYVFLPWRAARSWLRYGSVGAIVVLFAVYTFANVRIVWNAPDFIYGENFFDGLIEVRQRRSPPGATVFVSVDRTEGWLGDFLDEVYGVSDTVEIHVGFDVSLARRECEAGVLLCYDRNRDRAAFEAMTESLRHRLESVALLNSKELQCFRCVSAGTPR